MNKQNISDLYSHKKSVTQVIPIDATHLKYILQKDQGKLLKLWKHLAHRYMIIHYESYSVFTQLNDYQVKNLAKISEVQIYQPGDHIDVTNGGILLRGGLSKLDKLERKMTKKAQLEEELDLNTSTTGKAALNKSTLSAQM